MNLLLAKMTCMKSLYLSVFPNNSIIHWFDCNVYLNYTQTILHFMCINCIQFIKSLAIEFYNMNQAYFVMATYIM